MTLLDAEIGSTYKVSSLNLDIATRRRLEALGLTRGTSINVLNRSRSGAVIIMVRGTRLAVGEKIAETIHTKEASR
ncbi:ferrous iron transport protein A [Anaerotaenia torta]|uniref:FeoA family protein n=1 Tax=Anaerotaenia torta TaxID=433293 RepID=UPI003D232A26